MLRLAFLWWYCNGGRSDQRPLGHRGDPGKTGEPHPKQKGRGQEGRVLIGQKAHHLRYIAQQRKIKACAFWKAGAVEGGCCWGQGAN